MLALGSGINIRKRGPEFEFNSTFSGAGGAILEFAIQSSGLADRDLSIAAAHHHHLH